MTRLLLAAAPLLLAALLVFEQKQSTRGVLSVKPVLSLFFVAVALSQPWPTPHYAYWMLPGFLACLVGDVCLALRSQKWFRIGLAAFLAGHLFYIIAFLRHCAITVWTGGSLVLAAAVGWVVFCRLKPHLGKMRMAVVAYIVVISLMVCSAFSIMGDARIRADARWLVLSGAVCFYLSDLFVARQRFIRAQFANRLIGLPLYYLGQFLLALSVGVFITI